MAIQRVAVGSLELSCETRGAGKPIVFLHGNAGTNQTWRRQIEHFARNYRVLAPDLRGHGKSDKPSGDYSMPAFVADLVSLFDALAIQQTVLVGHSMGGRVALSLALEHADRVAALVLVGTSAAPFGQAQERIARVRTLGLEGELREFIEFEASPDTPEALKRELLSEAMQTPEHVRIQLWETVSAFDVSRRLAALQLPTLIIVGELDRGTPVAAARELQARIRESRLVVLPGVAHFTMLERPALVNQAIETFLRDTMGYETAKTGRGQRL